MINGEPVQSRVASSIGHCLSWENTQATGHGLIYYRGMGSPDRQQSRTGNRETQSIKELIASLLPTNVSDADLPAELEQATREAASQVVKRLRHDQPRMLREHYKLRRGFEQRLEQVWGQALDLYEAARTCCLEAGEEFYVRHRGDDPNQRDPKFEALVLLHARACMVASEVQGLMRTGHAVGAQARWRTLHELAVISSILCEADQEIAQRFLNHRIVERYKDAEQYQRHCEALGYEKLSSAEFEEIRTDYERVIDQYERTFARDWGWARPVLSGADPKFTALEEAAGVGHMRPWYRLSSHATHAGATGALDALYLYGDGQVMLAGPSNAGLADPGHAALIALSQVTSAFLLQGSNKPAIVEDITALLAIQELVKEAGQEFLAAHRGIKERD